MPLRGTRVVHRDFSAHHTGTVEGTMTSLCTITRDAGGTLDEDSADYTAADALTVVEDLPCRVQIAGRDPRRGWPASAIDVTSEDYLVSIPKDAPTVAIDDLVAVDGLLLRVADVGHGSETWQRDLFCRLETKGTGS